jgi:thiamine biosynthesis lipoprotein
MTTLTRLRIALGTFVAVEAEARDAAAAERGIDSAFEAISRVERLMHPTRPGSDLAALRACAPANELKVNEWTWQVLELCQRLNQCSHGTFDPCLATAPGRMTDLELLPGARVLPRVAMHVDLGGIAKGFAVDRAIDALRDQQCAGGLVNAGGDVAVFGARHHIFVCRGPEGAGLSPGTGVAVRLRDAALATSDTRHSARPGEHRGYYHGVNRDADVSGHATVIAARAAVADALTKCVLAGDQSLKRAVLEAFGARQVDYSSERQSQAQVET